MDNHDYITEEPERRRCQHLQREERGTIQHLHRMKWTLRQIAKQINCSASTVLNELRRGGSRGGASRLLQQSEGKRYITPICQLEFPSHQYPDHLDQEYVHHP